LGFHHIPLTGFWSKTSFNGKKNNREGQMREQSLDSLRKYGKELHERLRLKTYPTAVKMLERKGDIPEGALRPKRDLGYHLATCQGFPLSR
jgi:uncharacterized protein (DUF169 family)